MNTAADNSRLMENIDRAREAFSRQSVHFDAIQTDNEILEWMRQRVHQHVLKLYSPGERILELNSGTGIDALTFARHGCEVVATDLADGMVRQMEHKVNKEQMQHRVEVRQCSYTNLLSLGLSDFDHLFSNFSGLNCLPDLRPVISQFPRLVKPGGTVTLVIMPTICPVELLLAFRGQWSIAFRRLRKEGAPAHIEGIHFTSYYFTPSTVLDWFGPEFRREALLGLATFVPPPFLERFPKRFPLLFRLLKRVDNTMAHRFPFNHWGDHIILTMRFLGPSPFAGKSPSSFTR